MKWRRECREEWARVSLIHKRSKEHSSSPLSSPPQSLFNFALPFENPVNKWPLQGCLGQLLEGKETGSQ